MSKKSDFKLFYALSLAWQLGFLIVLTIGGLIFLGIWGDKYFGTHPFLLITGIISGVALSIYESYHLLVPLIERKND